jgi:hypothetical protein
MYFFIILVKYFAKIIFSIRFALYRNKRNIIKYKEVYAESKVSL